MLVAICGAVETSAEIAPQSLSRLRQSELIVVGTIKEIRIQSERSRIERGFGNYDWGIYLTLGIDAVEKGQVESAEIKFRCFRIKSRRSAAEYLTPSGHRPIPGIGTRVRVYLNGKNQGWTAVLPNGITSPEANDDDRVWSGDGLTDAAELSQLRSLSYTFLLPLELWGVLVVFGVPVAIISILLRRRARRRLAGSSVAEPRESSAAERTKPIVSD